MIRLLADENILGARELLSQFGHVDTFRGRSLTAADLAGVDVLLVRSVTKVNADLLAASNVRFVGSATIGTDHLDIEWLDQQGIAWCSAPGSNAHSVVDYCFSALCAIPDVLEALLEGERVGIIGYGNVGSRLHRRLSRLGIECIAYDPLLTAGDCPIQASLDEVLSCAYVSVHTPLTRSGAFPSYHLLDAARLCTLPSRALLLNAGRGEVLATAALKTLSEQRPDIRLVLDVWENEPLIDRELVARCTLATPHIAGYSQDGKWQGLLQVAAELATCIGQPLHLPEQAVRGMVNAPQVAFAGAATKLDLIKALVQASYDIREDDRALRKVINGSADIAEGFDGLRRHYPARREMAMINVVDEAALATPLRETLAALRQR